MAFSKALQKTLKNINKKFGEGKVGTLKEKEEDLTIKFYKTPSVEFNNMLGGGFAQGKLIELYGANSSGKTSMAMETIAHNQAKDPEFLAGWFETEESFDFEYAELLGIDTERMYIWDQRQTGAEEGLDILRALVVDGSFDMIVINSVAGLTPKKELEDDMEKANIALQARMMSKLMRVITGAAAKNKCSIIFVNQLRTNVGQLFGNPNVPTGGKALGYYASQRIGMRKNKLQSTDPIDDTEGVKIHCIVRKNRVLHVNPYRQCDYFARFGKGIDNKVQLPKLLVDSDIIQKGGGWYKYVDDEGENIVINGMEMQFHGKTALLEALDIPEIEEYFYKVLDGKIEKGELPAKYMSKEQQKIIEKQENKNQIQMEDLE